MTKFLSESMLLANLAIFISSSLTVREVFRREREKKCEKFDPNIFGLGISRALRCLMKNNEK